MNENDVEALAAEVEDSSGPLEDADQEQVERVLQERAEAQSDQDPPEQLVGQ